MEQADCLFAECIQMKRSFHKIWDVTGLEFEIFVSVIFCNDSSNLFILQRLTINAPVLYTPVMRIFYNGHENFAL